MARLELQAARSPPGRPPVPGWFGVDHGQGRHHPGAARLGDHRGHRQDALRALRRPHRPLRRTPYARIDAPATREEKARLAKLSPAQVTADTLAGEPVTAVLTEAPGNGVAIGGIKVTTENAWFAARPSGTEDVYKIYGESFLGADHLRQVQDEAKLVVLARLGG